MYSSNVVQQHYNNLIDTTQEGILYLSGLTNILCNVDLKEETSKISISTEITSDNDWDRNVLIINSFRSI